MPDYRIYLTNPAGHIELGYNYTCDTDQQAREKARSMLGQYKRVEVWNRAQRICIETPTTSFGSNVPDPLIYSAIAENKSDQFDDCVQTKRLPNEAGMVSRVPPDMCFGQ